METKIITTPVKKQKVEIKTYLRGRDKLQIERFGSEEQLIGFMVKKIDGDEKDIVEKMLDMHGKDFDFVVAEISKIGVDFSYKEKKTDFQENIEASSTEKE